MKVRARAPPDDAGDVPALDVRLGVEGHFASHRPKRRASVGGPRRRRRCPGTWSGSRRGASRACGPGRRCRSSPPWFWGRDCCVCRGIFNIEERAADKPQTSLTLLFDGGFGQFLVGLANLLGQAAPLLLVALEDALSLFNKSRYCSVRTRSVNSSRLDASCVPNPNLRVS